MATITDSLDSILREEISAGIREQRNNLDPVWTDIISTSRGVTSSGMGRDWKFKHAFVSGSAGAYEFTGGIAGPTVTTPGDDYTILDQAPKGFPGRTESVLPAFFLQEITLKEGRGNVYVPLKWWTLDKADGAIGSAIQAVIKGMARKIARTHAVSFMTKDATYFKLVDNIPTAADATYADITIDNSDANAAHGRIQMLEPGMVVDVHEAGGVGGPAAPADDTLLGSAGAGTTYAGPFVISRVNYLNNTFRIVSMTGATADFNCSETENTLPLYITLRGSMTTYEPSGLNTWMKTTGTINGIDYTAHPEFQSYISTTESGPLTEATLRNKIGLFIDRMGSMVDLDLIMCSAGVLHAYMENEDNIMTIERNGRLLDINAGWADMKFSYHGKPFRWVISTFIEAGTLFVIKTGNNNIKEYLPPRTPGTGNDSSFGDVEFIGPAGGLSGIWAHEQIVTAETAGAAFAQVGGIGDNLQAPFWRMSENCPDQVQGIKLSTFDESY